MNKKSNQQLKVINARLEKLVNKMNKDYNNCVQELLQLSTLLQNLENGSTETNKALLRPMPLKK